MSRSLEISDPLLDDVTLLMSAALMPFSVIPHPKAQEKVAVCGVPFDSSEGHDSLPHGGGA
jgi:hypothetical protein